MCKCIRVRPSFGTVTKFLESDFIDHILEKSLSYQRKDRCCHVRLSCFWYDNGSDHWVSFSMTLPIWGSGQGVRYSIKRVSLIKGKPGNESSLVSCWVLLLSCPVNSVTSTLPMARHKHNENAWVLTALPRCALLVSILAQKLSNDVKASRCGVTWMYRILS